MPAKGATKATAVAKAPAVKKTIEKDKGDGVGKQAQCFRNLMKYRASDLCKKAGIGLGVHGIKCTWPNQGVV